MTYARITDALRDLVFAPDPQLEVRDVLDRYYSDDYTRAPERDRLRSRR